MSDYEVTLTTTAVVYVVAAKDEEQAVKLARECVGSAAFDNCNVELLSTEEEQDRSRRHADFISRP